MWFAVSAAEVAASSDVVCIVVNTDAQVLDVTLGADGLFAALARKDLEAALERATELGLELPATQTGYAEIDAIYGLKGLGLR